MRLTNPRITPLQRSDWTDEQRALLEPYEQRDLLINILTTLAHHPTLMTRYMAFTEYLYDESTLPPRDR